jgi:hypothetical protein
MEWENIGGGSGCTRLEAEGVDIEVYVPYPAMVKHTGGAWRYVVWKGDAGFGEWGDGFDTKEEAQAVAYMVVRMGV